MEARQSSFMHPSCLEAHATPSHENDDRAPSNPPSTHQHPQSPAMAPGSPVVPCSKYTRAYETKEENREKTTESAKQKEKTKNRRKGPAGNQRRCCPSGNSESEISVSSVMLCCFLSSQESYYSTVGQTRQFVCPAPRRGGSRYGAAL